MIDYTTYLRKGLAAAEKAEHNKNEIASVFKELNRQLDEATAGKIQISRVQFYVNNSLANLAAAISNFTPREKYWAIAANNKKIKNSDSKELAKWKMDKNGYPCSIILGGDEMYCEDKAALEKRLQLLLSDPVVGEILHKLMSMPPDSEIHSSEHGKDD